VRVIEKAIDPSRAALSEAVAMGRALSATLVAPLASPPSPRRAARGQLAFLVRWRVSLLDRGVRVRRLIA